ncbi:MAG: class I SAM-dependent methyltransferase [Micrococcales bacterium]|nr:class I SAM-dependent methyltransferase [Micrococcales bacterium]
MPVPDEPRPDASDNVRADRAEVESHEVVTANRAWWDANAESYYAEHGDFLGDDRLVWGPEGWTEDELDLLGSAEGAEGRDGHEGRDILEVGAGAAQGSRYLAGRGARVVASDVSMGMLRRARRIDADRAAGGSAPTVPLVQCDGCVLPFADAAFDVVFTAYGVLPFVVDAPGFFRECARVLRAGGRLVAAEPHPIRWCFPDEPDHMGLTVTLPYWDRRAYTERDSTGRLRYAETHPTLGSRIEQIVDAGLRVQRLVEPEWPDHNPATWGGWSPLRGQYLPGSVIWVLAGPD